MAASSAARERKASEIAYSTEDEMACRQGAIYGKLWCRRQLLLWAGAFKGGVPGTGDCTRDWKSSSPPARIASVSSEGPELK
jgi:hypothetical protein